MAAIMGISRVRAEREKVNIIKSAILSIGLLFAAFQTRDAAAQERPETPAVTDSISAPYSVPDNVHAHSDSSQAAALPDFGKAKTIHEAFKNEAREQSIWDDALSPLSDEAKRKAREQKVMDAYGAAAEELKGSAIAFPDLSEPYVIVYLDTAINKLHDLFGGLRFDQGAKIENILYDLGLKCGVRNDRVGEEYITFSPYTPELGVKLQELGFKVRGLESVPDPAEMEHDGRAPNRINEVQLQR